MVTFPSAFKVLRNANVTKEQKLLVLKGRNYGNKATLYDKANKSLKTIIYVDSHSHNKSIKLAPVFLA